MMVQLLPDSHVKAKPVRVLLNDKPGDRPRGDPQGAGRGEILEGSEVELETQVEHRGKEIVWYLCPLVSMQPLGRLDLLLVGLQIEGQELDEFFESASRSSSTR